MCKIIEMPLSSQGGRSAVVTIRLLLNCEDIPVAQMGTDCLFIDAPVDRQPGEAILVLKIDQSESCWKIWLPDGISAKSEKVWIAALTNPEISEPAAKLR